MTYSTTIRARFLGAVILSAVPTVLGTTIHFEAPGSIGGNWPDGATSSVAQPVLTKHAHRFGPSLPLRRLDPVDSRWVDLHLTAL